MKSRSVQSVRLNYEQLEPRELPSAVWAVESFDTTTPRTLPNGWVQWNSNGNSSFQVIDGAGFGSNNGLATTGTSDQTARAWMATTFEKDIQVQADVFLN